MMLRRTLARLGTIAVALVWLGCGGGAPTLPVTPVPAPVPTPAAPPTPLVAAHCGTLAPGPVLRYAVAPRAARVDGENVPMRVWIQGPWQEAWGSFGDHGFNYRLGVDPRGLETSFGVQAQLDGVKSKPWQSGPSVGYAEGPLRIVTLSAADIEKNCKCTYFGNGNYNPECTAR